MFGFFKDLGVMINLFFASKPSDISDLTERVMHVIPFGAKYMMWCGVVMYKESSKKLIDSQRDKECFKESMNHEKIHLRQAQVKGSWLKFYASYVWEWIKGIPFWPPFDSAYHTIPYEMEAYGNESDFAYTENYDGRYLHCYDIKKRKKTYKEHEDNWEEYCEFIPKVKE